jgi:hypothetical protein
MMLNLDHEIATIACTKALTDERARLGHGVWMAEPEVSFIRAQVYNRAGLQRWDLSNDREACRRLRIHYQLFVRTPK